MTCNSLNDGAVVEVVRYFKLLQNQNKQFKLEQVRDLDNSMHLRATCKDCQKVAKTERLPIKVVRLLNWSINLKCTCAEWPMDRTCDH